MPGMLQLRVTGLQELQGRLANTDDRIHDDMHQAMTAGLLLFEGEMRRQAPRDTGRLQGSIHHTIEGRGASLSGRVGPSVRYGYWVEYGRRAGKYPPIDAIRGWARRHGVPPFQLARAIARRGTKAQPFVIPTFQRMQGRVVRAFDKIGVSVVAYIAGGR